MANQRSRDAVLSRVGSRSGLGSVQFVPIIPVVLENGGRVGCLFQQETCGLIFIFEGKYDLLTINRQYRMVRHNDFRAYSAREHTNRGQSTFRAKPWWL